MEIEQFVFFVFLLVATGLTLYVIFSHSAPTLRSDLSSDPWSWLEHISEIVSVVVLPIGLGYWWREAIRGYYPDADTLVVLIVAPAVSVPLLLLLDRRRKAVK